MHTGFGEKLLFDVKGGVIFSFDNTLDSHMEIASQKPGNNEIVLQIG